MRLLKERLAHIPGSENNLWSTGFFKDIFTAVIEARAGQDLQSEFLTKFVKEFEDVRYSTFTQIGYVHFRSAQITQANSYLVIMHLRNDHQKLSKHSLQFSRPATWFPDQTTNLKISMRNGISRTSGWSHPTPTKNRPRKLGWPSYETISLNRSGKACYA